MNRLEMIRESERISHMEVYENHELYQDGSWLRKPVKTVLDLLPLFDHYNTLHALDLGCGVGRNCIAIAQHFQGISCRIDCVDILDLAIEKLMRNAKEFHVTEGIHGVCTPLEAFPISPDTYDLILAVSALEHVDSEETFMRILTSIRDGLRKNGIFCLIMNTDILEFDKQTRNSIPVQFEINMSGDVLLKLLEQVFDGWNVLKYSVVKQRYDIPRGESLHEMNTNVLTYAVKKLS